MTEPITILAVDDQPPNLRLLDAVLSPRGYRVITASSGEEALELLPSEKRSAFLTRYEVACFGASLENGPNMRG